MLESLYPILVTQNRAMNNPLIPTLSAFTPEIVDHMYHIDSARPSEAPTFLFIVGSPGSGKSSGHAHAIEVGLIPAGDYATINLDTLLESMAPFRAASSMAHLLKHRHRPLVKFASIFAYGTRKENLGLFKWYDEAHEDLAAADPETIAQLNRVRSVFAPLAGMEAPEKLMDLNEAAIERAISRGINIVYETTFSLTKKGRVTKFDEIIDLLKGTPYKVAVIHVRGDPREVSLRIRARQEFGMPHEEYPFYRYVSWTPEAVTEYIEKTAEAVEAIAKQYPGVTVAEFVNTMDPMRLPTFRQVNYNTQRRKIVRAYGPARSSSSTRKSSSSRRRTTRKTKSA
jgi:hypothetical protein